MVDAAILQMGASTLELEPGSVTVNVEVKLIQRSVLPAVVGLELTGHAEV